MPISISIKNPKSWVTYYSKHDKNLQSSHGLKTWVFSDTFSFKGVLRWRRHSVQFRSGLLLFILNLFRLGAEMLGHVRAIQWAVLQRLRLSQVEEGLGLPLLWSTQTCFESYTSLPLEGKERGKTARLKAQQYACAVVQVKRELFPAFLQPAPLLSVPSPCSLCDLFSRCS